MQILVPGASFPAGLGYATNAAQIIADEGISNAAQKTALTNLEKSLRASSLWAKNLNYYPLIGGTQSAMKWNLRNTLTHPLTFTGTTGSNFTTGGFVCGSGVQAVTDYIPAGAIPKFTLGVYNSVAETNTGDHYLAGVSLAANFVLGLFRAYTSRTGGGLKTVAGSPNSASYPQAIGGYDRTKTGLLISTNEADSLLYDNGTLIASATGIQAINAGTNTAPLIFGANRVGASAFLYSGATLRFLIWGADVLTAEEVVTLNAIVNQYIVDLAA